jgi:hypothetical protein
MLLLFTSAAIATAFSSPVRAEMQATATIRIERPAIANDKAWDQSPKASRREIIRRDERGQPLLLRVVEYQ